eukprot:scaffold71888_cov32-Tisochrysis_lutea.AAC.2
MRRLRGKIGRGDTTSFARYSCGPRPRGDPPSAPSLDGIAGRSDGRCGCTRGDAAMRTKDGRGESRARCRMSATSRTRPR